MIEYRRKPVSAPAPIVTMMATAYPPDSRRNVAWILCGHGVFAHSLAKISAALPDLTTARQRPRSRSRYRQNATPPGDSADRQPQGEVARLRRRCVAGIAGEGLVRGPSRTWLCPPRAERCCRLLAQCWTFRHVLGPHVGVIGSTTSPNGGGYSPTNPSVDSTEVGCPQIALRRLRGTG
jgi:hypothetical protein